MPVFLAWLSIKATEHAKIYPDKLTLEDVHGVKTFTDFDTRVTSPVFGFSSPKVPSHIICTVLYHIMYHSGLSCPQSTVLPHHCCHLGPCLAALRR